MKIFPTSSLLQFPKTVSLYFYFNVNTTLPSAGSSQNLEKDCRDFNADGRTSLGTRFCQHVMLFICFSLFTIMASCRALFSPVPLPDPGSYLFFHPGNLPFDRGPRGRRGQGLMVGAMIRQALSG
jgi:hypothetical protein